MKNDGYIKKSDAETALLALRKGYRRTEEKCAVDGCILEIQDLPTVDAVEVVRCKDCKHYNKDDLCCGMNSKDRSTWFNWYEDDFCSYGERKDNEYSM